MNTTNAVYLSWLTSAIKGKEKRCWQEEKVNNTWKEENLVDYVMETQRKRKEEEGTWNQKEKEKAKKRRSSRQVKKPAAEMCQYK